MDFHVFIWLCDYAIIQVFNCCVIICRVINCPSCYASVINCEVIQCLVIKCPYSVGWCWTVRRWWRRRLTVTTWTKSSTANRRRSKWTRNCDSDSQVMWRDVGGQPAREILRLKTINKGSATLLPDRSCCIQYIQRLAYIILQAYSVVT